MSFAAPRPRLAAALALAAGLAAATPRPARAAACCVSATSFGVGRLLAWEDAAAGLSVSHARSLGQWDSRGSLRWNASDYSDGLTTTQLWGIVRAQERVQLQGWVPFVVNDRRSAGQSQLAGGLGDLGAAARVEVVKIGEYQGLPSFAFTVGGFAPTGRRPEDTKPPLFAGTTGRGAWGGSLAAEAEYAFLPWFVRLDGGVTGYLPFRRSDTGQTQRYGPILQSSLSTGLELVPDVLVAAVALTGEWESSIVISGDAVPGSRARQYGVAGSLAWRFDPRWTVTAGVNSNVWPDGAGQNRDARVSFTLGVRRGHF